MLKKIIITVSILFLLIISGISYYFLKENKEIINHQKESKENIEKDNKSPELKLKKVIITENEKYTINSFVSFCTDNISKKCKLKFKNSEMSNYKDEGIYKIVIIALDNDGNEVKKKTILKIIKEDKTNVENNDEQLNNENINDNKDSEEKNIDSSDNLANKNEEVINSNHTITKPSTPTVTTKPSTPTTTKPIITTTTTTTKRIEKVDTLTETKTETTYKYGATINNNNHYIYDIYSDGSRILVNNYLDTTYDYSTFNASTNDLKSEAQQLVSTNINSINEVLSYVNQYRSEVGAAPLSLDSSLNLAATIRSLEMAWSDTFSHTRPNGSSCFSVADELGIGYYAIGENIASGYYDAASVSNGWKNSPGHYRNMISTKFGKIGIGVANVNGRIYWTQIFTN